jgi:hypothetical protein
VFVYEDIGWPSILVQSELYVNKHTEFSELKFVLELSIPEAGFYEA